MIDNLTDAITRAKERARTLREYVKPFAEAKVGEATKKYIERCLERAEYNEQLAAWLTELQERREADRWISVKDRMPEPRVAVMVYCPEYKNQYCAFYEDKHWQVFGAYDTVWHEVTHWKPLSQNPEESEAENE